MSRYHFADVELDVDRFVVTRAGRRLDLEPKAIDVLRVLVERPGRLVTKDELLDAVWPGVAVTPNALTRVVAQLRRELGDDASAAKFIETVPTRGYRLIVPVAVEGTGVAAPVRAPESDPSPPGGSPAPVAMRRRDLSWAVAAVVLMATAALWMTSRRTESAATAGVLKAVGGETGSVLDAQFSPDGRWLALVVDRDGAVEISLRDVATGTTRPLTADGMRNVHPSWSPDATRVAYHSSGRGGIWVIGIDGGAARQVAPSGSRPAWSPDGRTIAFQSDEWVNELAQPGSHLLLVPADATAAPAPLTAAGAPPGGHGAPHWAPDGTTVYFASARNGPVDFWSVRVRDGLLTKRADSWPVKVLSLSSGPSGLVALGVDRQYAGGRLVRVPLEDDDAMHTTAPEVVLDGLPSNVRTASIAPGGRAAAIVLVDASEEIWTVPVTAGGAPTGEPRRLTHGGHPSISPDGTRVAYDTGTEIRVRHLDGSGERVVVGGGRRALNPTWRNDRAVFAMRIDGLSRFLVEADLDNGVVTERLPLPEATSFPRVAPDGDTVVATLGEPVNRVGRGSLAAGTFAPWPLFDGYAFPVFSPDGRRLALEKKVGAHMPMFVADVATGAGRQVSPSDGQFWPGGFSPDGRRVAIGALAADGVWRVEVLDLATGTRLPLTRERSPEVVSRYPSWSPRGDTIAYARMTVHGTLHLVDLPASATR